MASNRNPEVRYNGSGYTDRTAGEAITRADRVVLCQDNGHIKPLFFSKISKMHKLVAFIPRFA